MGIYLSGRTLLYYSNGIHLTDGAVIHRLQNNGHKYRWQYKHVQIRYYIIILIVFGIGLVQYNTLLCFDESKCGIILDPKHNNDKIGCFSPNIYWSCYEF
jgi:hypothetical protein